MSLTGSESELISEETVGQEECDDYEDTHNRNYDRPRRQCALFAVALSWRMGRH
jgi:hypothetical protein